MKFCSHCAHPVSLEIPLGDNRERYVCSQCKTIHYENPRIVAGVLPVWEGKVLLCKRAIEPRKGYWTLPAGFMENGESTEQAAMRETLEEANARVQNLQLYSMITVPHISQVHLFFLADLKDTDFHSGPESLETELFDEKDIPWKSLAFPTVSKTLHHYFHDRRENQPFSVKVFDILWEDRIRPGKDS